MSAALDQLLVALGAELGRLPGASCGLVAGSAGRDEASIVDTPSGALLLGDVEIVLVVRRRIPERQVAQALANAVASTNGFAEAPRVETSQVPARRLSGLQRKLFVYELRECGRCIFGRDMRAALPAVTLANLDRAELHEIYLHRLEALLKAFGPDSDVRARWYAVARNTLDIATWLLPLDGVLLATYGRRAGYLADHPETPFLRAMPAGFAERVERYTAWKLDAARIPAQGDPRLAECLADFDAAETYARRVEGRPILRRYSRRRRVLRAAAAGCRAAIVRRATARSAAGWVIRDTLVERARLARIILGWFAGEPRSEADDAAAARLLARIRLGPIQKIDSLQGWREALLDAPDVHRGMA